MMARSPQRCSEPICSSEAFQAALNQQGWTDHPQDFQDSREHLTRQQREQRAQGLTGCSAIHQPTDTAVRFQAVLVLLKSEQDSTACPPGPELVGGPLRRTGVTSSGRPLLGSFSAGSLLAWRSCPLLFSILVSIFGLFVSIYLSIPLSEMNVKGPVRPVA